MKIKKTKTARRMEFNGWFVERQKEAKKRQKREHDAMMKRIKRAIGKAGYKVVSDSETPGTN